MKKKIAIFGSTGSIGKTILDIIANDKNNFEIILLTARDNHISLIKQAKKFNVKNLIITNKEKFNYVKNKTKKLNINIYNDFTHINKIFNFKLDYIMSAITGIDGLKPTIESIKHTKKIAIANKESIICGWNLILKELKKNKTEFIPVDSEHFTVWYAKKHSNDLIDKIILTASGGPFINLPLNKFKSIKLNDALKHPTWKMGKKISIDSATMMNKVFEIIEAKNLFKIKYKNISVLTHPDSYVHSLIKYNNGVIKIIAHDTTMKIPIFNSIYSNDLLKKLKTNGIDVNKLNNLNFKKIDKKRFPLLKILTLLPEKNSLFETILVSANDSFVEKFLNEKIRFTDISKELLKFLKAKEFNKYKNLQPKNINEILDLNKYVRLKIFQKSI